MNKLAGGIGQAPRQVYLCLAMLLPLTGIANATALAASEGELRAAVIVGILRFTTSPARSDQQYTLCLAGKPPSADKLRASQGMHILQNQPLTVAEWHANLPLAQCPAVVMGPTVTPKQQTDLIKLARTSGSVLLCDDCTDSALAHAALLRKDEGIGFSVDVALARTAHISFSSQLLKLADNVQTSTQQ